MHGTITISGEFRAIKGDLYMALSSQVVDFIGLDLVNYLYNGHGVSKVGVMKLEVRFSLQVSDALTEVYTAAADDAVNFVSLLKQELTKIGSILSGHTGN